jgi:DNA polymerase III delta prime subunit
MTVDVQQRNTGVPLSVFISYAHEDEPLRQQLEAHLSLLRRQGLIADWQDRQILAGEEWAHDIDEHLETASLILLLISPDFLASEYCYGIEMRQALERHENGEAQVIPIIVRPVDWEGAPFAYLQCLPRDARAVTEWDNRDAAFRDITRGIRTAIDQLPSTATQPQNVPTAPGMTAAPTDRNRQRMLKRVHATWIAGVLEQSLHGAALMVLGLEEKADVLDNPWRLLMQEVDRAAQPLPDGTRIIEVYNATEGGLLILGEPGAGKTTLLLELARDLIDRAQTSENAPIPVVFNLSSWAKKQPALSNWLVEELSIRYEVPRRLGQSWVSEDRLLLLLDGLDEVASAARKDCIEAINNYRQTHPDVQVVVCSRSAEYLNEPTQLRLHTALVIQPLTQEQIDTYLESAGKQAEAVREALRQDADLRELATTPLMLTILLFAYMGTSPDKISELTSLEAKREQLFASYVQHMLKRRGASKRYQPEQITNWLTYLARQMKRQNQTVFYIEQMQPDWLLRVWPRSFYRVFAGGVSGGLLCGLIGAAVGAIFSLIFVYSSSSSFLDTPIPWPAIAAGLVIGLIIGQILGSLIGLFRPKSTEIRTVEVITWSWENARLAAIASIVGGSLGALILYHYGPYISNFFYRFASQFPINSFFYWLFFVMFILTCLMILILPVWICFMLIYLFSRRNLDGHRSIISRQRIGYAARRGALVGTYIGCISLAFFILTNGLADRLVGETDIRYDIYLVAVGCVSGLITGLIYGVSRGQLETHASIRPNQGIWRSLYNGGRVLLIVGLIAWLVYDIPVLVSYRLAVNVDFPSNQFLTGVIVGISIGLFFGLLNGGIACIKHVLLRVFLWRSKALPWNYVRFLDYAAERILLRKVGGGYIFVHRLMLEYFASLPAIFPEAAPAIAVISDAPPVLSSTSKIDTVPREEKTSLPVPGRKTGFNKEKRIATLFVVVILLELSCGAGIFSVVQYSAQKANDATATAQAEADNATAIAQAEADNATATAQVVAQVEANATAEALANVSPIAYPPKNISPILNDPLQDNSRGNNWEVDNPGNGNCKFINRVYDINTNQSEWCLAMSTDFKNFIYEVQMKIVKGDEGGIAFRIDPTSLNHYEFDINQDGSYSVHAYFNGNNVILTQGSSSAINRRLNQTNRVAAVVQWKIIELYVNYQRVAVVGSNTFTRGQIGVIVTGSESNPTEVIFQNAKIWKL